MVWFAHVSYIMVQVCLIKATQDEYGSLWPRTGPLHVLHYQSPYPCQCPTTSVRHEALQAGCWEGLNLCHPSKYTVHPGFWKISNFVFLFLSLTKATVYNMLQLYTRQQYLDIRSGTWTCGYYYIGSRAIQGKDNLHYNKKNLFIYIYTVQRCQFLTIGTSHKLARPEYCIRKAKKEKKNMFPFWPSANKPIARNPHV